MCFTRLVFQQSHRAEIREALTSPRCLPLQMKACSLQSASWHQGETSYSGMSTASLGECRSAEEALQSGRDLCRKIKPDLCVSTRAAFCVAWGMQPGLALTYKDFQPFLPTSPLVQQMCCKCCFINHSLKILECHWRVTGTQNRDHIANSQCLTLLSPEEQSWDQRQPLQLSTGLTEPLESWRGGRLKTQLVIHACV